MKRISFTLLLLFSITKLSLSQQIVDSCFTSTTSQIGFPSSADLTNDGSNEADLGTWNGAAWTGFWALANLTIPPPCSSIAGDRAIFIGNGTTWTTGGEGFGVRLSAPLVAGVSYTFNFTYVSNGFGSTGAFAPLIWTNNSTSWAGAYSMGSLPSVGYAWTTNAFTFTAVAAQAGHTWILLNTGPAGTSGLVNQFCGTNCLVTTCAVHLGNDTTLCTGQSLVLNATIPSGTTYLWQDGSTNPTYTVTTAGQYWVSVNSMCADTINVSYSAPATVNAITNITQCAGTTIIVPAFISNPAGATFTWTNSNPAIGLAANGIGDIPNFTGINAGAIPVTSTITVTPTTGCAGIPSTFTITINPLPVITVNSPTICPTTTANLTANGGTTYTWTAGTTVTGFNTADATPAMTTTYTVTGTTAGCFNTAVATVTVSNNIAVTVNSPTICAGQTAQLIATGATTYAWTAGATSVGFDSATATPLITTTYTVTGTSAGCTGTAIATVTVTQLPVVTVNSPSICASAMATLTATGGTTYNWSAGATPTGINTATASPLTTTTYTVTGLSAGCQNTAVATVTVTNTINVTVNSPTICAGQIATLTGAGATTYTWSAGATSTGTDTATASPIFTTTYTVTGTSAGCSNTAVSTVSVNPLPTAIVSGGGIVCSGVTVPPIIITLTGVGPWNITYTDGITNTSVIAAASPYTITNPMAGTYSVTLISDANCTGTFSGSALVEINPLPVPVFTANPLSGCEPLCVTFNNTTSVASGSITNWAWTFGDGGTSNQQSPNYCFNTTGIYSVSMTATSNNNCTANRTVTNMITVNPTPIATFTVPSIVNLSNTNIQFSDFSTGATSWNWDFGDLFSPANNNISTLENPTHTYSQAGAYCVLLTVTNGSCIDTSQICLDIQQEFTFYIPNSFSPNGDGINDEFYGKGQNINTYEMWIYDRWGNSVFYCNDINKHWDGTMKGNVVQEDVYVYIIKLFDFKKEEHKYIGSVTIEK